MNDLENIQMAGPDVTKADANIVKDALENGWYGKNAYKYVELFEAEFAKYHNRKYSLMTVNCTSAIHLILEAIGIKSNDEVIVPDSTWIGSSAGIKHAGGKAIFADISEDNWCINVKNINKRITNKTKAVISVNLYGNMPDYDELIKFLNEKKIHLIEDAAESLGSIFRDVRSGKFGLASVFSFHRTKTITTGEGGIILTDDKNLYEECKILRDHGRAPGKYFNTKLAYKYMPFNVQAALGYAQLLRIDELVNKKISIFERYKSNLSQFKELKLNQESNELKNGVWATVLEFDKNLKLDSQQVINNLEKINLPSRPFFYPLSSLPAYNQKEKYEKLNINSYDICRRAIVLPSALNIKNENIDYYCEQLLKILKIK